MKAPGDLETLRAFVNTLDVEESNDAFDSPEGLASWLVGQGLLAPGAEVAGSDLERALGVREALRALLLAHHDPGDDGPAEARAVLEDAGERARFALRFGAGRGAVLEPTATGVDAALGRLLAIAFAAMADGAWERLKVCPNDACAWAFYDASRNRSGRWCSMAVCGNRAKVRAYRERLK